MSWRPSPRERLEVRGGYLGSWDDTSRQTGAFGFSPPPGGVSPVATVDMESESELYGGELNYWHELACRGRFRFDAGIGARYVRLDETATVRGFRLPTGAGGGFLQSEVESDFFAAQFGLAAHWDVAPRWEVSLLGKGLVGLVSTDTEVNDVSLLSGGPHAASADDGAFGWGFEVEARVLYRITPRHRRDGRRGRAVPGRDEPGARGLRLHAGRDGRRAGRGRAAATCSPSRSWWVCT